jgi:hypothetical protein
LTAMAKELIEIGLQKKVKALVDAGKLRTMPTLLSSHDSAKPKSHPAAFDDIPVDGVAMTDNITNAVAIFQHAESQSMNMATDETVVNGRAAKTNQEESNSSLLLP